MTNTQVSSDQIRGYLNAMLLAVIEREGEAYADQIIKHIDEASQGSVAMNPSSVYRALPRLRDEGFLKDRMDRKKGGKAAVVYYRLTKAGREELVRERNKIGNFASALEALRLLERTP